MKIYSKELINRFYKEFRKNNPDSKITLTEMERICESPWKYLAERMEDFECEPIRFTHFGTFKISPYVAKRKLEVYEKSLEDNPDKIEEFKYISKKVDKYLK